VRIRRFVLLHKQLDADDEELTRTRKVRRGAINSRYGEIIDALYEDTDTVTISSLVTYQDGSTASREISLRIAEDNGGAAGVRDRSVAGARG
jgi:long-chain acyl-CoA synthetase